MFKFSCEKALLSNAIATVSRAVQPKSSIQVLEGILITAGAEIMLTGYNLETGIRTVVPGSVEQTGSVVLNTRLFGEIVRKMPDDVITLTCDEKLNVKIDCGQTTFNLLGMDAEEYPEMTIIEDDDGVSVKQCDLRSMLSETLFAVSESQARPIQTGALFEVVDDTLTVVCVDGYRLAMRKEKIIENDLGDTSFVVPGPALREVEHICENSEDDVLIKVTAKHVMFHTGATILVSRRLEGEFLNYKKAIPRNNPISIFADKKALTASFERVALIISEKTRTPVRCKFDDGVITLRTSAVLGNAYDECQIDGDGNGLEIGFNDRYILDALKAADTERVKIELSTGVSPAIILPEDDKEKFLYMVLPVRLR